MRSWLAALRIARREARRAKGRSALVIALIGLPIMALSFAAVTYDSFRLTPAQQWERQYGAADAVVSWPYDGPVRHSPDLGHITAEDAREQPATAAEVLAMLPPGSRLVRHELAWVDMQTAAGVGQLAAEGVDLADPISAGRAVLRAGRAPAADNEVALTELAAARLDATIGQTVHTADGEPFQVVGTVEFPINLGQLVVFLPGAVPEHETSFGWFGSESWLWEAPAPVSWDQVKQLNQHGIVVESRAVRLDPPPASEVDFPAYDDGEAGQVLAVGSLIAGLGLLEVVLLAGPAFAVGVRRRERDLALVAANGGTPQQLRRVVLADGVVLGVAGAVAGMMVGAAVALATRPLLEQHIWVARAGGYRFFPLALAGVAGLAVLIGLLAALVPAFIASRQPVVTALAGRRGVVRSRKRWLALGLAMICGGAAVTGWGAWQVSTSTVLTGLIIAELGLVLCTPALVGLVARGGRFIPLAPRIALRDTARNRAAAAPAISAVMAAVAGGLALGIFLDSDDARQRAAYWPAVPVGSVAVSYEWWRGGQAPERLAPEHHAAVHTVVRDGLPAERLFEVRSVACPDGPTPAECDLYATTPEQNLCPLWQLDRPATEAEEQAAAQDERCRFQEGYMSYYFANVVVDDGVDGAVLAALTGADGDDVAAAMATLRSGGVVVTDPWHVVDGTAILTATQPDPAEPAEPVEPAGQATEQELVVPAYVLASSVRPDLTFVPPAVVAEAGLASQAVALVAQTSAAPTTAQRDALTAALQAIEPELSMYVEQGSASGSDPSLLILAGAAAVVTLGAAGIATGLAAADRRGDLSTLGAVGASPRVRRLLALSQSGVIAGLGTVLGAVAGAGAALAVLVALNQRYTGVWPSPTPYPIEIPWSSLAILLTVPLVAMLGAGLLTRSRLPIERRAAG